MSDFLDLFEKRLRTAEKRRATIIKKQHICPECGSRATGFRIVASGDPERGGSWRYCKFDHEWRFGPKPPTVDPVRIARQVWEREEQNDE